MPSESGVRRPPWLGSTEVPASLEDVGERDVNQRNRCAAALNDERFRLSLVGQAAPCLSEVATARA